MSELSPRHETVHARLKEVFGDPDHSLGRDDHWAIKPGPQKSAINVLVDGVGDTPAVWVFDPHIKDDGVMRTLINTQDDLEAIIKRIQARVAQAAAR